MILIGVREFFYHLSLWGHREPCGVDHQSTSNSAEFSPH